MRRLRETCMEIEFLAIIQVFSIRVHMPVFFSMVKRKYENTTILWILYTVYSQGICGRLRLWWWGIRVIGGSEATSSMAIKQVFRIGVHMPVFFLPFLIRRIDDVRYLPIRFPSVLIKLRTSLRHLYEIRINWWERSDLIFGNKKGYYIFSVNNRQYMKMHLIHLM